MVDRGGGSLCGGSVTGTPQALQPRLSSDVTLAGGLRSADHGPPRAARALTLPCVSVCLQCSIQRTAFDRCASLAQPGGTFPLASGPSLTLLVRRLLFFYRQSEDSKRLVSVDSAFTNPCVRVFLLLVSCGQTTPQQGSPCELPQSAAVGCLCDHVFSLLKLIDDQ